MDAFGDSVFQRWMLSDGQGQGAIGHRGQGEARVSSEVQVQGRFKERPVSGLRLWTDRCET